MKTQLSGSLFYYKSRTELSHPVLYYQLSSLKSLDVTELQTFAIVWSQVISAGHNKGNMEVFSDKRAVKI